MYVFVQSLAYLSYCNCVSGSNIHYHIRHKLYSNISIICLNCKQEPAQWMKLGELLQNYWSHSSVLQKINGMHQQSDKEWTLMYFKSSREISVSSNKTSFLMCCMYFCTPFCICQSQLKEIRSGYLPSSSHPGMLFVASFTIFTSVTCTENSML